MPWKMRRLPAPPDLVRVEAALFDQSNSIVDGRVVEFPASRFTGLVDPFLKDAIKSAVRERVRDVAGLPEPWEALDA